MSDISTFGGASSPVLSPLTTQADKLLLHPGPAATDSSKIEKSAKDFESILLGSWLQQAEQRGAAMETMGGQSLRVSYVSEAYLLAGRMQEAVQLAKRALTLARAHKERGHEAWVLRLLGEVAAHQAPLEIEPAAHHYRQALALAEELGMRPLIAHCYLGLGKLYRRTGKREQAQEHLTTATTMYREMGMTYWLERAKAELQALP